VSRDVSGQNPEITIITPTKNRLVLLREAMDSVTRQTFANWEHIVVDDGSEDETSQVVERRSLADSRVRFIRRTGDAGGANVCRNIGIRASRGEFILFLDSDDLLEPDCLEYRVACMRRNADLDFVTFQTAVFEKTIGDIGDRVNSDRLGDHLLSFLFFENPWIITAPIWRKASLFRLGLFDEALPSWQDLDLHIRALTADFAYIRNPRVDHHVRWQFEPTKVSVEQRRSPYHLDAAIKTIAKFESYVRNGPGITWVRQRALCSLYFFVAEQWLQRGQLLEALRAWREARRRALAPPMLHASGLLLLLALACGKPGRRVGGRVAHKWKGWARLRTNPELVRR